MKFTVDIHIWDCCKLLCFPYQRRNFYGKFQAEKQLVSAVACTGTNAVQSLLGGDTGIVLAIFGLKTTQAGRCSKVNVDWRPISALCHDTKGWSMCYRKHRIWWRQYRKPGSHSTRRIPVPVHRVHPNTLNRNSACEHLHVWPVFKSCNLS